MTQNRLGLQLASWTTAVSLALALPACTRSAKAPELVQRIGPSAEFLALDTRGRNLLVYDAFWDRIESNYYDPKFFATAEWRTVRAQWREKAAAVGDRPLALHNDVLMPLLKLMPESHFNTLYPTPAPGPIKKLASAEDREQTEHFLRLYPLMQVGPGISTTEVRRGNRKFNLVSDVWHGTQAEESGIRPGWRVLQSSWHYSSSDPEARYIGDFMPLDASAARAWENGEVAETPVPEADIVHIKFDLRENPKRGLIETRELAGGVRYVRFDQFADESTMAPVFAAIDKAGPAGLILDLRWNGGGSIVQERRLAGALLGEGALMGTIQDRKGISEVLASKYERRYNGPLLLLVGPVSASATEITAAAVQDHKRGRLIGRRTNGSVLTSYVFDLPDGGHVQVPITNYFRVGGKRMEGAGVEPDVWILPTLEEVRAGHDPVLERALKELGSEPPAP
jgi:carboxyl-terminal processing protease